MQKSPNMEFKGNTSIRLPSLKKEDSTNQKNKNKNKKTTV